MSGPGIIWINGRLEPADRPLITVTDRGFQVGDGIFETMRVVGGRILEFPMHVSRLRASAAVLAIPLPADVEHHLGRAVADVCRANQLDGPDSQAAVRVTVSRGAVDGRALLPPEDVSPTLVVQAWPVDPPGFGSGPLSNCTMSRQPSSARCATTEFPTIPDPITTTFAAVGRSLTLVLLEVGDARRTLSTRPICVPRRSRTRRWCRDRPDRGTGSSDRGSATPRS